MPRVLLKQMQTHAALFMLLPAILVPALALRSQPSALGALSPSPVEQRVAASEIVANTARFVQALEAGEAQRIVCYGTSLTAGGAWVDQLEQALGTRYPGQVEVINRGRGGEHSRWGLAHVQERVIDARPDVVFIEFAINDAAQRFDLSVQESAANLTAMVEQIRAALPACEIILQVMNPATDRPEGHAGYRGNLDGYEQTVRDTGDRLGLRVIDHAPAWGALLDQGEAQWKRYVPDGLHPNRAGYAKYMLPTLLAGIGVVDDEPVYDVVVYGGTSAGVIAAVQAKRDGRSVVIVCPDTHLGGLSSGGLGWTDSGDKSVIGGLSRTFYQGIYDFYQQPDTWRWQTRESYGNTGQGSPAIDGDNRTMWIFEPHAAEAVFEALVERYDITVHRDRWLDREAGVEMQGPRIQSITTLNGETYRGRMFIDATYEGDLMAAAGVRTTVGRESNEQYGESLNGNQPGREKHQFTRNVDPYVVQGDPASGLLPRIQDGGTGEPGVGDRRVQAYCFRMCLTQVPENRVPFPRPEHYDPGQYELLLRAIQAHGGYVFNKFDPVPNRKTDTNNHGPFSLDNIGMNWDYPEASYARRAEIIAEHRTYQMGYFYFLANDPRVPADVRERMGRWGLAKDEFVDNGHWPHQIYVREARRMVSDFVVTENHLTLATPTPRPIGMGSYNMDSHNVRRYVDEAGFVRNEGDVQVGLREPYPIDYGAIVPRKAECENLLVPVCLSASHIAFGSIRMEPVFMILAQSAAQAADLAIERGVAVQDIDYGELRERLEAAGQRLGTAHDAGLGPLGMDDSEAELIGPWLTSRVVGSAVGGSYRHDDNANKGEAGARFTIDVPEPGRYEVRLAYTPHANRATEVPVEVEHARGNRRLRVNQRLAPPIDGQFISLGVYDFDASATVTVTNRGTRGYVTVDAVLLVAQ
ncbi:MAG: FAD-dependent oxidoreductase [Phycisphaerales bacterium JB063]